MTKTSQVVSPRGFHVLLVNHMPDFGSKALDGGYT